MFTKNFIDDSGEVCSIIHEHNTQHLRATILPFLGWVFALQHFEKVGSLAFVEVSGIVLSFYYIEKGTDPSEFTSYFLMHETFLKKHATP